MSQERGTMHLQSCEAALSAALATSGNDDQLELAVEDLVQVAIGASAVGWVLDVLDRLFLNFAWGSIWASYRIGIVVLWQSFIRSFQTLE